MTHLKFTFLKKPGKVNFNYRVVVSHSRRYEVLYLLRYNADENQPGSLHLVLKVEATIDIHRAKLYSRIQNI
jgi:hypothetical protein